MVQIRLNSSLVEYPAMDQALENDNRSVESNSCEIILKASQKPAKSNILPENKNIQPPNG